MKMQFCLLGMVMLLAGCGSAVAPAALGAPSAPAIVSTTLPAAPAVEPTLEPALEPTAPALEPTLAPTAPAPAPTLEPTVPAEPTAPVVAPPVVPTEVAYPDPWAGLPTPPPTSTPIDLTTLPQATLIGHYTQIERKGWGTPELCEALVVTGGSPEMIQRFVDLIAQRNGVNSLNEQGQPVINLPTGLSGEDVARIQGSSAAQPVELTVVWPEAPGGGAGACYSFVEVMAVRSVDQAEAGAH